MRFVNFKLISILVFCPLLFFFKSYSQEISGKALDLPPEYNQQKEDGTYFKPSNTLSQPWFVMSPKSGIATSKKINGTAGYKHIKFLENFYVANMVGDQIQLARDEEYDWEKGFSKSAIEYGWVNKDKMILHNQSLYLNNAMVYLKGLIINNPIENTSKKLALTQIYKNPELTEPYGNVGKFEIYLCLRATGQRGFIGNRPSLWNS
jgi:hypothetical protein